MKMKLKKLSIALCGLFLASCSLDIENTNSFTDDNYYSQAEPIEEGILHTYAAMVGLDYVRPYLHIPIIASEQADVKDQERLNPFPLDTFESTDASQTLEEFFRYSYLGINRANVVLRGIAENNLSGISTEEGNYDYDFAKGELLFLRAYHHFMCTRIFGRIPLRTEQVQSLSDASGRNLNSYEEIYDLIISDLTEASSLMTVNKRSGRVDKVAAEALLSKVYITMASSKATNRPEFEWVDADEAYRLAAASARFVVNDQTAYSFDPDFTNLFSVETRDAIEGPEHIWYIDYSVLGGTDERIASKVGTLFWKAAAIFGGGQECDTYVDSMGRPVLAGFSVYELEPEFLDNYEDDDLRKTQLYVYDAFPVDGGDAVWTAATVKGTRTAYTAKYLTSSELCISRGSTQTRPYLLRFSDILLVLAEAVGPTAEGYDAVNRIRERAFGNTDNALTPGLGVEEFRQAIVDERALELAFEGNRLYDLRRTNTVESAHTAIGQSDRLVGTNNFYAFPIPRAEIQLNPNN